MAGSFGYELDLNRLSEEEKQQISIHNQEFKELWPLIHNGAYYRLSNPFDMKQDQETAAWMHVSEDQQEALVFAVLLNAHGNPLVPRIRLKGLKAVSYTHLGLPKNSSEIASVQVAESCNVFYRNIILKILFNKRSCFSDVKIPKCSRFWRLSAGRGAGNAV